MDLSLIKDLVDLARNGYKPADVKELLTMMKEEPDKKDDPDPNNKKDDPDPNDNKDDPDKKDKKELLDAFAKLVEDNK